MLSSSPTVGWDIGGVNTKVARAAGGRVLAARSQPFELQRAPDALVPLLARLARDVGARDGEPHAVTMTAELSQMFRTKREGVRFVLDAVAAALPGATVRVFAVDGRWLAPDEAAREPLAVAAANWAASARMVARAHPDCVLVDVGTTTADVIPVVGGRVAALGRTDPERLQSGELVYTGALRTPVEAVTHAVPLPGGEAGVSAEGFALVGDAHLWLGDLAPADYTVPTPDGRAASREGAGERLARVVCADRELLDDAAITAIARHVAEMQTLAVARAITRVRERQRPEHRPDTAVVTGLGAFLAMAAARRAGIARIVRLADEHDDAVARSTPAAAVAMLLGEMLIRDS
jgi:(4-(4-[2-(gamma-L-glutamylamino)ethyl]phenoxymethyl)furan-2-yl)methanamine synthase